MIGIEDIKAGILAFEAESCENEYNNNLAWDYCYEAFSNAIRKKSVSQEEKIQLSLYLTAYLASWGMYRGSSFISKSSFIVHNNAADILLDPRYKSLLGIKCREMSDEKVSILMDLVGQLKECYKPIRDELLGEKDSDISDTLVSKIVLASYGCIIGYDSCVLKSLKNLGIKQTLDKQSIEEIRDLYKSNESFFEEIRADIKHKPYVEYTQMKILDMGLWEKGSKL